MLRHETMKVYQRSLEFVTLVKQSMKSLPQGYGFLADQQRRAVSSISLNIAEGLGRSSRADQRRFFSIAKASCAEVAATFDVGLRFEVITQPLHQQAIENCDAIVAMLTKLSRR